MKPGYKQTEVGIIPEEWEVKVFGELAIPRRERIDPKKEGAHEFCIELEHIESRRGQLLGSTSTGTQSSLKSTFRSGDVLFGKLRAYLRKYWRATRSGVCSTEIWVLVPRDGAVTSEFLFQIIQTDGFIDAASNSYGTHMPRSDWNVVKNHELRIPRLAEQRAIAEALSDVDGLLGGLDRLIAKKRDLKEAAMQQLLTGQTRLPGFHGKWEVKRLGEVAEIVMGQSPASSNFNTKGMGLPLIQGNADIDNRKTIKRIFTTQITKRGRNGDILMSVRAPVGEVSRAVFDVCLGRGVCAIRYENDFMYHCLIYLEPTWAKHSKGSTFDSVNSADVKALEIHLPTDHAEQTAIAEVLTEMDAELAGLEQRREKTRALKQAMMQELLTGRIRLVGKN